MKENPEILLWIGLAIVLAIFLLIYLKAHRNTKVLISIFICGLACTIVGITLIDDPTYQLKEAHAAAVLFSPLIYITVYQILRVLHKRITGLEPAYEFASFNDSKDKRSLSAADFIVFLVPLLAAIIIPIIVW